MNLIDILQAAGVDGNKADFYLASLELGEATVASIAQKAGIGRTNAYEVLDRLVANGLVSTVRKGARNYVIPQDPIALLRHIDSQRQIVQRALPRLRSMHNSAGGKAKVRYFRGIEGIKTVLNEMLECQSRELHAVMSNSELFEVPGFDFVRDVVARRVRAGINMRVIRSGPGDARDIWRSSDRECRELRFAPADFEVGVTAYMYDDTVAFISSRTEHYALSIQSTEFFAFQRSLFDVLWRASTPDEPDEPLRTVLTGSDS